jgi:modulator of FtsH protease
MGEWADFFVAELGAAAALAGLVIVAISINVGRILATPSLPGRAAETLVTPTGVLIASTYALVPHQPAWLLAGEIGLTGMAMWIVPMLIQFHGLRVGVAKQGLRVLLPRILLAQFASLPFIATGILLYQGVPGALYWIVPGVVVSLIATVINAWVLLVEILR